MKVAIVGCAHGELDKIYHTATQIENQQNEKIDLLICCGDFQATRNESDLRCMAIPEKYYNMGSFYKYYSGEKVAPIMTIFIGGNHEASNYLQELPYGGWVAPKIYYMGYAGVINVGNIRIGGLSGIFKPFDYMKGHFEKAPYNNETKRSVYHVRNVEVFRLKQISGSIDVMLSHDWPRGVYNYGSIDDLIKNKPFFRKEVNENKLGSEPCEELLFHLKPKYWFSAHLHTKFSALIPHNSKDEDVEEKDRNTQFLALDKCLPKRKYIEIIEVPSCNDSAEIELCYDLEWLTILYLTDHLMSSKRTMQYMPGPTSRERWSFTPTAEEKEFIFEKMGKDLRIPMNFERTTQAYEYNKNSYSRYQQPRASPNRQTIEFCQRLGIKDPLSSLLESINVSNNYEDSPFSTPEKKNSTTFLSFNDSSEGTNSDIDYINQSPLPNRFISDFTSTPDYAMKKRKFSFPSFREPINGCSSTESSFSSFKEPNNDSSANSLPFQIDRAGDVPISETPVNEKTPDLSFPSFKDSSSESSSADMIHFQIDRAGDVPNSETPVTEKKQFKRRNGSLYQNN